MSKMQRKFARKHQAKPPGRSLYLYGLHVDLSAADLREEVQRVGPAVISNGSPYFCCVQGYDRDPRELWQIPEVVDLCRRVLDSGFASLLEVNLINRNPMLWGAWDVYACANRLIQPHALGGAVDPTLEQRVAFIESLGRSNEICNAVLREAS